MENVNSVLNTLFRINEVSLSIQDTEASLKYIIKPEFSDEIHSLLKSCNITINELLDNNTIEIDREFYTTNNIQPYKDIDSFYNRFDVDDFGKRTILIFQQDNDIIIFGDNSSTLSYFYKSRKHDFIVSNIYFLKKIKKYFLPVITDYNDPILKKYVILSPECGKFEIFETNLIEIAKMNKSLENTYKAIEEIILPKKGYEFIIKNRIIRSLEVIDQSENRFYWLIKNLDKLIEVTQKDYEVFITSFKHETILEQYEHEKDNFADKIRTVLEKLSTNLLSIPITFSAVLFGLKEISEKWLIDIFLIALALFVFYSCIIQVLLIIELKIIKKEIFSKINYFSIKVPTLKDEFNFILKPHLRKILFLQILTGTIIIAFIILYCYLIEKYMGFSFMDNLLRKFIYTLIPIE